jgi:hypothetical protein
MIYDLRILIQAQITDSLLELLHYQPQPVLYKTVLVTIKPRFLSGFSVPISSLTDCGCVHGLCDNRPGSGGVCQQGTCAPGFQGRFCNESMGNCGSTGLAQPCHSDAHCVIQEGVAR